MTGGVLAISRRIGMTALFSLATLAQAQQPQLSGIWKAEGMAYRDLNANGAIVDPSNGKLPYQAEAMQQAAKNFAARTAADPDAKCFQPGVPRGNLMPYPLQILQNDLAVYITYERAHAYRILYLNGSPHNEGLGYAMGDSRAHWEGSTLVADVLSFSDKTWFDAAGHHHSEALHVVERYTLIGPDTIAYEARVEDPEVFTAPWTLRVTLRRQKGVELEEDECEIDTHGARRHVKPYR